MISDGEGRRWAHHLGVALDQIRRDHLVSHVLFALSELPSQDFSFVGGTALYRTDFAGLRLSEDIVLLVQEPGNWTDMLTRQLPRRLRRDYPDLSVTAPSRASRSQRHHVTAPGVPGVEIQLIKMQAEDAAIQMDMRPVSLRYDGLPSSVQLRVPSAAGFVAMKYVAYRDRHEPRDLFDLAHLTLGGAFDAAAFRMIQHLSGASPQLEELRRLQPVTADAWHERLSHQTGDLMDADEALTIVRNAVARFRT